MGKRSIDTNIVKKPAKIIQGINALLSPRLVIIGYSDLRDGKGSIFKVKRRVFARTRRDASTSFFGLFNDRSYPINIKRGKEGSVCRRRKEWSLGD